MADHRVQPLPGGLEPAHSDVDDGQGVAGPDVVRIKDDGAPVGGLGLLEAPGAIERRRFAQRLLEPLGVEAGGGAPGRRALT